MKLSSGRADLAVHRLTLPITNLPWSSVYSIVFLPITANWYSNAWPLYSLWATFLSVSLSLLSKSLSSTDLLLLLPKNICVCLSWSWHWLLWSWTYPHHLHDFSPPLKGSACPVLEQFCCKVSKPSDWKALEIVLALPCWWPAHHIRMTDLNYSVSMLPWAKCMTSRSVEALFIVKCNALIAKAKFSNMIQAQIMQTVLNAMHV